MLADTADARLLARIITNYAGAFPTFPCHARVSACTVHVNTTMYVPTHVRATDTFRRVTPCPHYGATADLRDATILEVL